MTFGKILKQKKFPPSAGDVRCEIGEETQEHLYSCQDLITDVIIQTSSVLNYHDLLGTNVEMVEKIIEPYYK